MNPQDKLLLSFPKIGPTYEKITYTIPRGVKPLSLPTPPGNSFQIVRQMFINFVSSDQPGSIVIERNNCSREYYSFDFSIPGNPFPNSLTNQTVSSNDLSQNRRKGLCPRPEIAKDEEPPAKRIKLSDSATEISNGENAIDGTELNSNVDKSESDGIPLAKNDGADDACASSDNENNIEKIRGDEEENGNARGSAVEFEDGSYVCKDCGQIFKSEAEAKVHIRVEIICIIEIKK